MVVSDALLSETTGSYEAVDTVAVVEMMPSTVGDTRMLTNTGFDPTVPMVHTMGAVPEHEPW